MKFRIGERVIDSATPAGQAEMAAHLARNKRSLKRHALALALTVALTAGATKGQRLLPPGWFLLLSLAVLLAIWRSLRWAGKFDTIELETGRCDAAKDGCGKKGGGDRP